MPTHLTCVAIWMDRHAFPIKCAEVIYGDNPDSIVEIQAEYDPSKATKPKVHRPLKYMRSINLQLPLSKSSSICVGRVTLGCRAFPWGWATQGWSEIVWETVSFRGILFSSLPSCCKLLVLMEVPADFCLSCSLDQNPAELEDWLGDLNPQSKEVIKGAYAVPSLANAVLGDKFQFERLGNIIRILFTCLTPWIKKIKRSCVLVAYHLVTRLQVTSPWIQTRRLRGWCSTERLP